MLIARDRVSGPCALAMRPKAAGINIDSETPSRARHASRNAPLGESPERAVKTLHVAMLAVTRTRLEIRSPRIPATGEHRPYTQRNRAPVRPTTASE
jgi:hypothetical protein